MVGEWRNYKGRWVILCPECKNLGKVHRILPRKRYEGRWEGVFFHIVEQKYVDKTFICKKNHKFYDAPINL